MQLNPNLEGALLLRARVYQQMKLTEKAIADTNRVLDRDPENTQAQQLRAQLLAGSGKLNEAIDDLKNLISKDPDESEYLLELAMFYAADQKARKAVETYTEFLKKVSDSWIAYRGRGDAYLSLGKQAEAVADYEAALKIDSENSGVLNNLAWLLATSPEAKLRNGARAIELATLACKVTDYKQSHILSTLAAAYAETGDFKTAIEWSTKAVELGEEPIKAQLRQELASYEGGKPWRESTPPAIAHLNEDAEEKPGKADSEGPSIDGTSGEGSTADEASPDAPGATSNLPRTKR